MYRLSIYRFCPNAENQSESIGIKDVEAAQAAMEAIQWRYRKDILIGNQVNEEIKKKENIVLSIDLWEKREHDIWHSINYFHARMNESLVKDLRSIND